MADFDQELRCFQLLQWVPYGLAADFDWELAERGHYSRMQRERSDTALGAFEAETNDKHRSELDCFRELESLKVLTQEDLFSPLKAKDQFYSALLDSKLNSLNDKQNRWEHRRSKHQADKANTRRAAIRRANGQAGQGSSAGAGWS